MVKSPCWGSIRGKILALGQVFGQMTPGKMGQKFLRNFSCFLTLDTPGRGFFKNRFFEKELTKPPAALTYFLGGFRERIYKGLVKWPPGKSPRP